MNKIIAVSLDKKFDDYISDVKKTALRALKILNKNNIFLEIYLINGQKMKFLNKKFRGKNKAASVLSFEEPRNFIYPPKFSERKLGRVKPASKFKRVGEIYLNMTRINADLNADKRRLNISENRRSNQRESALLIHGLLHLFGFDHKKKNDRIKMEKKEHYVHHRLRYRFGKN